MSKYALHLLNPNKPSSSPASAQQYSRNCTHSPQSFFVVFIFFGVGIHREERELSSYSKALQVVVVCCTTPPYYYSTAHYSVVVL